MKALLVTTALAAAVLSAPLASAQVFDRRNDPAVGAFAQSPLTPQQRRGNLARAYPDGRVHSTNPSHDVYDTRGDYVGSDPDPFIRNELRRAPPNRDDN